jgi:hypothetical protein
MQSIVRFGLFQFRMMTVTNGCGIVRPSVDLN